MIVSFPLHRCMIQDIFDPEYYLSTFEIKDLSTGKVRLQTGKYRDLTPCGPREELNPDSDVTVNRERQSFYAISIPGIFANTVLLQFELGAVKKCFFFEFKPSLKIRFLFLFFRRSTLGGNRLQAVLPDLPGSVQLLSEESAETPAPG